MGIDENLDKLVVFDFINRVDKDLRSLSYDTLVLLHIIMVIDRHSVSDKAKIFEIIDDEISKRQQYKQKDVRNKDDWIDYTSSSL